MTLTLMNVFYVLLAIAMIGFILVQRGAGAQAGSGFGSGASATVFGARGASNFLTKSTAILATGFFLISLAMGIYISRSGGATKGDDLGVMSDATRTAAPATEVPATPAKPAGDAEVPAAPAAAAPAAPAGADSKSDVPAAPAQQPAAKTSPEQEKK